MSKYERPPEGLDWRVSRTCEGGACVAVARSGESVFIGNSGDPVAPVYEIAVDEWREFLAAVKSGHFDEIA